MRELNEDVIGPRGVFLKKLTGGKLRRRMDLVPVDLCWDPKRCVP